MKKILSIVLLTVFTISAFGQHSASASTSKVRIDCKKKVKMPYMYNHVKVFTLNGEKFVFTHHDGTGQTKISPLESSGFVGYQKKWSTGWTNIDIFEYKGKTYLFHLKRKTGFVRISELNYADIKSGKRLGPKIFEANWSGGWSTTDFFVHKGKLFFYHYKNSTGRVRINVSTKAGDFGKRVFEAVWSKDWNNFDALVTHNNVMVINQKLSNGDCAIKDLNTNALISAYHRGSKTNNIGPDTYRKHWDAGWSHVQLFEYKGVKYLLAAKLQLGEVKIHKLNRGKVGPTVYEGNWGLALSAIDVYKSNGKPHVVRQNNITKRLEICEIKLY